MNYSHEVECMCPVTKGPHHGPAPIPEEGRWVKAYQISDISGLSHGIGWCAPQQGACKLTLNVKNGIIEEALVETIGCSGMTHSAAMAGEILPGKTLLEALNTDLVCDAINGFLILMDERRNVWAERMFPGSLHYIPGKVAHRVANTGYQKLVFSACWPSDAGHDYATIADAGFARRLVDVNGVPTLV